MTRKLPIIPTIIVLIAVATMIRLGFWQIDRLHQKEAMLAEYESALRVPDVVDFKSALMVDGPSDYRRVLLECRSLTSDKLVSGRDVNGQAGWAHQFRCTFPVRMKGQATANVVVGWSENPIAVVWRGGKVFGTLVPSKENGVHRVVADPPLAGLAANAKPDPRDIPNNHLAYAVQWFLFAAVALIIYVLAVRKRARG